MPVIGVDELRCIGQAIIVDLVDGRSLELAERAGFETTGTIQEVPLLPAAILTGFGERPCDKVLRDSRLEIDALVLHLVVVIGGEEARVSTLVADQLVAVLLDESRVLMLDGLECLSVLILEEAEQFVLLLLLLPFGLFVLQAWRLSSPWLLRLVDEVVCGGLPGVRVERRVTLTRPVRSAAVLLRVRVGEHARTGLVVTVLHDVHLVL